MRNKPKIKILVLGGSGFLGRNILDFFSRSSKYKILSTFNKKPNLVEKIKGVNYIEFNLKKNNNFKKILKFDPHYIFFLAWEGIPNFSKNNSKTNYSSSVNFIKNTKRLKSLKKIIYFGSCWESLKSKVNKNNIHFVNAKLRLKDFFDDFFFNSNVKYVWLRLFYVYGPYQRKESLFPYLIDAIKQNVRIKLKQPEIKNDYVHVFDLVKLLKIIITTNSTYKLINFKTNILTSSKSIKDEAYKIIKTKQFIKKNSIFTKKSRYIIHVSKKKKYLCKINLEKGVKTLI